MVANLFIFPTRDDHGPRKAVNEASPGRWCRSTVHRRRHLVFVRGAEQRVWPICLFVPRKMMGQSTEMARASAEISLCPTSAALPYYSREFTAAVVDVAIFG